MGKVSIVIPTYNRAAFLEAALKSVEVQYYDSWEVLVVDDGSDDGTEEMMAAWVRKEPRIHYIQRRGEKKGACVCRNIGISKSSGEFVMFLDSDDWLLPDCLRQRVEESFLFPEKDVLFFPSLIYKNGSEYYYWNSLDQEDILAGFLVGNPICQTSGGFWRKRFVLEILQWDENLQIWQDLDFHVRALLNKAQFVVCSDREPDVIIREQANSISRRGYHDLAKVLSRKLCFEKWLQALVEADEYEHYRNELRTVGWNVYQSILKARHWPSERTMYMAFESCRLFSLPELRKIRFFQRVWRWRGYKLPFMDRKLKRQSAEMIPAVTTLMGRVPYERKIPIQP